MLSEVLDRLLRELLALFGDALGLGPGDVAQLVAGLHAGVGDGQEAGEGGGRRGHGQQQGSLGARRLQTVVATAGKREKREKINIFFKVPNSCSEKAMR